MMKLWLGVPVPFSDDSDYFNNMLRDNVSVMVREGTSVDIKWLKYGYSTASHAWTSMFNAVEGVKRYYEAWKMGYDGVIIECMADPGLIEARSLIDIPVVGICQSAAMIATCLGNKFSIIVHDRSLEVILADKIRSYGMTNKLASIRCIDISAVEALANPAKLISEFSEVAMKMVTEDEAEVIIPGCSITGTILTNEGVFEIEKVPIIDPVWAGIKMAEVLVDLKQTYGIEVCRATIYSAAPDWEREIPMHF